MGLVLTLTVVLYDAQEHKLMRQALFTFPLGAVALAGLADPETRWRRLREARPGPLPVAGLAAVALLLVGASVAVSVRTAARLTRQDEVNDERSRWLASIHDESTVVMGPPRFAPSYPVDHYPVQWCMTALDGPSYLKVASRYTIGTLLSERRMSEAAQRQTGMRFVEVVEDPLADVYVYRRVE
jgi:hypothetical protein